MSRLINFGDNLLIHNNFLDPLSGTTRRPYQPTRTYTTRRSTQRTASSIKTTRKQRITAITTQKTTTASSILEEPINVSLCKKKFKCRM